MNTISASNTDLFLSRIRKLGIRSTRELAKRASISQTAISLWLSGKRPLSPRTAEALAVALGTTPGALVDLIRWQPDAKPEAPTPMYWSAKKFQTAWEKLMSLEDDFSTNLSACEAIAGEFFLPLAQHYVSSRHCRLVHLEPDEAAQIGACKCLQVMRKFDPNRASAYNFFTKCIQHAIMKAEIREGKFHEHEFSGDTPSDSSEGDRAAAALALMWASSKKDTRYPAQHVARTTGLTLDDAREVVGWTAEQLLGRAAAEELLAKNKTASKKGKKIVEVEEVEE